MKLSQVLHTITPTQLIIVREHTDNHPTQILVKGTRKDIPKDSHLNNCTVETITYSQAYMIIGIILNNKLAKGGVLL